MIFGAIAGALAGTVLSGGRSKTRSSSSQEARTFVDPSQQPFLQDIRRNAQALYNQGGMPVEGVAGINPMLRRGINNQFYGGGNITGQANNMMRQGAGMMQGSNNALGFSNNAMASGPASGAGFAIGTGNVYSQGVDTASAANMNASTNQGFNQANLSNYINNDILQGQIDAASTDVLRNLQEVQLPGIASNASGSGNSGSSRRAVMDAIATRGAADRIGDISAAIRAPAYMQGVGIEAARAQQNAGYQQAANEANAGYQQAANLLNTRSFNDARDFGSQLGGNAFNNNMQNQQFGASLAATLGNQGASNVNTGAQMFGFGNAMQQASGQYQRDYQQQLLNQRYRQGMAPYGALDFYNQIIGSPNNLNEANSQSKGSSSSFNVSFGPK